MDILKHVHDVDVLAHAYLLRTSNEEITHLLMEEISEHRLHQKGSPDLYLSSHESLGVDEARSISDYASLKPLGSQKYIIIAADRITTEAQSALLKIVEEGSGHSIFFFIVKPGVPVLPTLLSRCVVLKENNDDTDEKKELGVEFLKLSYKERLSRAEKFGKDSDREGARALVRSLLALSSQEKFDTKKLRDVLEADQYLQLSGSSPKGVVGHLALVL